MTIVTEISIAESWTYQVLAGDPTMQALAGGNLEGRLWPGIAPAGTVEPYVIMSFQAARDVNALGNGLARILSRPEYQVVAMGPAIALGVLDPWAARIDELLHGKSGTLLDDDLVSVLGRVYSCIRVRPFTLPQAVEGKQYRRLGGIYRYEIQKGV
jgi:hypothetical protein